MLRFLLAIEGRVISIGSYDVHCVIKLTFALNSLMVGVRPKAEAWTPSRAPTRKVDTRMADEQSRTAQSDR